MFGVSRFGCASEDLFYGDRALSPRLCRFWIPPVFGRLQPDMESCGMPVSHSTPTYVQEANAMTTRFSFSDDNARGNGSAAFIAHRVPNMTYDFSQDALDNILAAIATKKAEQGGALGMNAQTGRVDHFFFDERAHRTSVEYSPNAEKVTEVINAWQENGVDFCGMIHSHPGNFCQPSEGDVRYARRILDAMPQTLKGRFLMPILTMNRAQRAAHMELFVVCQEKGGVQLVRAAMTVEGKPLPETLNIPTIQPEEAAKDDQPASSEAREAQEPADNPPTPALEQYSLETIFQRNASLLPLDELAQRTVVIIGCGGARGFCESLARSGVGRMILVDGDTVSVTNVATQGTYLDEIGLYKTEVIAKTLHRINPHMKVVELRRFLDEELTDGELEEAVGAKLLSEHPEHVLLCGCTDNFPAQDRTVKLALKWGVPYLASQTYATGRGGEVLFTYPGLTTACPRCMLASRYEAYAKGAQNDVTSEGAPLYSTDRLNALKAHVAMAMLLHGTSSRLGGELAQIGQRNLILTSFAPDCEEKLGLRVFSCMTAGLEDAGRAAMPMEQTLFLHQTPDRPENGFDHCPYCGGVGDLRLLRGLNADTRRPYDLSAFISAVLPRAAEDGSREEDSGRASA